MTSLKIRSGPMHSATVELNGVNVSNMAHSLKLEMDASSIPLLTIGFYVKDMDIELDDVKVIMQRVETQGETE